MSHRLLGSFFISGRAAAGAFAVASLIPVLVSGQTLPDKAKSEAAPSKIWAPPRTPDGHPDLQGIWSNAMITPLERPADLAGKAFLTEQEAAEYEKQVARRNDVDHRDAVGTDADVALAYNQSWYDRGTKTAKTRRTSLIVDPPDGADSAIDAGSPETSRG